MSKLNIEKGENDDNQNTFDSTTSTGFNEQSKNNITEELFSLHSEETFEADYQALISNSLSITSEPSQPNITSGSSGILFSQNTGSSKSAQSLSLLELTVPVIASKFCTTSSNGEINFSFLVKKKGPTSGKSILKSINIPSFEHLAISTMRNISDKDAERSLINTLILENAHKLSNSEP